MVVSARLGNVASDAIDEREMCLGWKLLGAVDGPRGPEDVRVARFDRGLLPAHSFISKAR